MSYKNAYVQVTKIVDSICVTPVKDHKKGFSISFPKTDTESGAHIEVSEALKAAGFSVAVSTATGRARANKGTKYGKLIVSK